MSTSTLKWMMAVILLVSLFTDGSVIVQEEFFTKELFGKLWPRLAEPFTSHSCLTDFIQILKAAKNHEVWALRIIDAWGKPGSGILYGNLLWFGSFDECIQTQQLNVKFCMTKIEISQKVPPVRSAVTSQLRLGMCIPEKCSTGDLENLVHNNTMFLPGIAGFFSLKSSNCSVKGRSLQAAEIICIIIFSLIAAFALTGTLYHGWQGLGTYKEALATDASASSASAQLHYQQGKVKVSSNYGATSNLDESIISPNLERKSSSSEADGEERATGKDLQESLFGQILMAFSLAKNLHKIMNTEQLNSKSMSCIHGLRFLSMAWVILGHSYVFALFNIQNIALLPEVLSRWSFSIVSNALLSVDTFFFISGTLASYLLLLELAEQDSRKYYNKIVWWKLYFHRYWRLTAPYALVLIFNSVLFIHIGSGPNWPEKVYDESCRRNWWTNLLYLNNYVHSQEMCMMWTWFLADDMQFFLITPPLVVLLFRKRRAALAVVGGLCLASVVATAVITRVNHYPPTIDIAAPDLLSFWQDIYVPSYSRLSPYLVGLLLGWLVHQLRASITLSRLQVIFCWTISSLIGLVVLFGVHHQFSGSSMSVDVASLYACLHRLTWAMSLGWVVFACLTNNAGPVNYFLSWRGFVPLARLTYMAYLLHPLVLFYYIWTARQPMVYHDYTFVYFFLGNVVVSYAVALVASLCVESPLLAIEKIVLPPKSHAPA